MFKEWKAIFKRPKFIVVMLGVSLIPFLYNVIFLSSMWDPYGKLSDLPVAVVNKDQSTVLNGKTLAIGDQMVANMEKGKALDFHVSIKQQLIAAWKREITIWWLSYQRIFRKKQLRL